MSRKIEVRIDKKGGVKIEALGFEGEGCTLATRKLEEALGPEVERELKPEFYEENPGQRVTA